LLGWYDEVPNEPADDHNILRVFGSSQDEDHLARCLFTPTRMVEQVNLYSYW